MYYLYGKIIYYLFLYYDSLRWILIYERDQIKWIFIDMLLSNNYFNISLLTMIYKKKYLKNIYIKRRFNIWNMKLSKHISNQFVRINARSY